MAQTYAEVEDVTTTTSSGTGQSLAVNMPATVNAGELLLMHFNSALNNITTPAGWTLWPSTHITQAEGGQRGVIFTKRADGTEGGTTVTVTHSGFNSHATASVHRLSNAGTIRVTPATTAANNTTSIDPSAVTPRYGSRPFLVIAFASANGAGTWSVFPTGYSNTGSAVGNGPTSAWASKQVTASSENPSGFTQSGAGANLLAWTIAVFPAESVEIVASADDGYADSSAGFATNTNAFVGQGSGITIEAFYRFQQVAIPQGANIIEAHIEVVAAGLLGTASNVLSRLYFNDADDAVAPTNQSDHNAKARTTAFTAWSPAAWVTTTQYSSPDISAVIQEVVDRPGWVLNNDMMLLWDDAGTANGNRLTVHTMDTASAHLLLVVEFEAGGVVQFMGWGPIPI